MSLCKLAVVASLLSVQAVCLAAVTRENVVPLIERAAAWNAKSGHLEEDEAGDGVGAEAARRIRSLGPEAIPYLLPLLKSQDKGVRGVAAMTLSGMEGLREEHLDALIESRLNGSYWIPLAIARVGTPKAIEFLADELKKEKSAHFWGTECFETRLTDAFVQLGEKGVPYLVRVIRNDPLNDAQEAMVVFVFGRLQDKAESAVGPLTEFISADHGNDRAVRCAVLVLGMIGKKAEPSVPTLLKLAQDKPASYKDVVDRAIPVMKAPQRVADLLRRLEVEKEYLLVFLEIATLRKEAISAGPALAQCLADDSWDVRVFAARAIGFVGYKEASPDLIKFLDEKDDWRQVFVAAESLGLLSVPEAIDPLTRLSENHWYPPVRDKAKQALRMMRGEQTGRSGFYQDTKVPDPLVSYKNGEYKTRRSYVSEQDSLDKAQLEKLVYKAAVLRGMEPNRIPEVGLKVTGGYLVGLDLGEFGGDVVFIDSSGQQTPSICWAPRGIHKLSSGIVAVTRGGHLGEDAVLYRLSNTDGGLWRAERWKTLPGRPRKSGLLANGNLCVECDGGTFEISPAGEIKMASAN